MNTENKIRVLLVDDHRLVRVAVKNILNEEADIEVVAEAKNGDEALQMAREHTPDIVLLDIGMPGMSGIEATRRLAQVKSVKVILLTSYRDDLFTGKLIASGASGYLTKAAQAPELVGAIRRVYAGELYITPQIAEHMATSYLQGAEESPLKQLSNRELEVLMLLCRGEKPATIAKNLFISVKTVNGHRYQLFKKLGVGNDLELTRLAIAYGLVDN